MQTKKLITKEKSWRTKESGMRIGIMRYGKLLTEMTTDEIGHADLERIYLENISD